MADAPADSTPAVSGHIFLSFAPEDRAEVSRLAAALARHGLPIIALPAPGTQPAHERTQREIRACELFLPVISPRTQANREGPFREEWQRAAERAAGPSDGLPFLVPLVLENIPAAAALVPEAFRVVQWIPLPAADEEAALTARLQEMLHQRESARLRRERQLTPPVWVKEPEAPPAAEPTRAGPLFWIGLAAGLAVLAAAGGWFLRAPAKNPAASPAIAAATPAPVGAKPTSTPAARGPELDAARIFLTSFENLTGEAALDTLGRAVGVELTRAFSRASGFQVQPGSEVDPITALASARRAGAAILVTGNCARVGKELQLRAQITFVASAVSYGVLGPVALDDANGGPALTEFVERMTTGVSHASAVLQDPPAQLSKLSSARPWARWPLAQRARELAALPPADTTRRIAEAQAILRADSSLADVRLALARALSDAGRYDEADANYAELYSRRAFLSQDELFELLYARSLLVGNLEAALSAARERAALRPRGGAIDDVVSCLLALNRPRHAAAELTAWLETMRAKLPPSELARREPAAAVLEVLALIRSGETARARVRLAAFKSSLGPAGSLAAIRLESLLLAPAGSRAELDRLLDHAGDLPSLAGLERVRLPYELHCQLLHVGRAEDAAYFLERAKRNWSALPSSAYASAEAILLEADLAFAQNRPRDALAALDRAAPPLVAFQPLEFDGRRALALQDLGRTADFAGLLNQLESAELRASRGLPLYWRARLAARAGLQNSALELLRLATARGLWLDDAQHFATARGRSEPEFAALRSVPAYDGLLRPRD